MKINNQTVSLETAAQVSRVIVNADGSSLKAMDTIVREHFLDIYVNERLVGKVVCTPSHLEELVLGRLLTEGVIGGTGEVESLYICEQGHTAKVFLREDVSVSWQQEVVQEPTCCTGNQSLLQRVKWGDGAESADECVVNVRKLPKAYWQPAWIFALANVFADGSKIHQKTKGTHSAYLGSKGECVFAAEDIGRHNALDKCIGYMLLQGLTPADCILFTTGRVPTDMVQKAVMAGVPVLASKAVPTDAAVELAKECGLTLICKAWPDRMEVYAQ
ncbi:MAG: formate dehydrogenase accessory sulfurtransferase FdhD [Lachnospiraceae bacterium]|nr:formate dehydrogenase accessory sulfurtransferase FdhD [Lachnospiraceae bacterium]